MPRVRQRPLAALAAGGLFALVQIGGFVRTDAPPWAKFTFSALLVGIAVAGSIASATVGRDGHRLVVTVVLVVVAEAVAGIIFVNAACYLGGCG